MGRRWGSAVVVVAIVAFGAGGGVHLWNEAHTDTAGRSEVVGDASPSARAAGKKKSGKKGTRGGAPRTGGSKARSGGGGKPRGGGGGGGGGGGPSVNDPTPNPLGVPGSDPGAGTDDDDDDDDPAPVAVRPPFTGRGPAGQTYEAAISSNKQEVTIGSQGGSDLTNAQLSGPMRNGTFASECGAPDNMKVTVKVAIKMGRPVGVSVYAPDPDVAGCIDRYVRTFSWPSNPKMDSFTTTY